MPILAEIFRYPVKSTWGEALSSCDMTTMGLPWDRAFMVADVQGRMVTGRTAPRLVQVMARVENGTLTLSAPEMPELARSTALFDRPVPASIWQDNFTAYTGPDQVDAWLSDFLGKPVHLLYVGVESARRMRTRPQQALSFADGYPLLLIGQASLDDLNQRIGREFSMRCFRPNLVIADALPYAEDDWKKIRIGGEVVLRIEKPCERCVFTTVDPQTGEKSSDQEPLRTLAGFRKTPAGVLFGQNMTIEQGGRLTSGMAVEILE